MGKNSRKGKVLKFYVFPPFVHNFILTLFMFFNIYAFSLKKKIYVYEEASSNVEKECMKM